jgi:hypothetical protein
MRSRPTPVEALPLVTDDCPNDRFWHSLSVWRNSNDGRSRGVKQACPKIAPCLSTSIEIMWRKLNERRFRPAGGRYMNAMKRTNGRRFPRDS